MPITPTVAPRCSGSFASSRIVSETDRKRRSYMIFGFIETRGLSSEGMVKTTWKYSMGSRSALRASLDSSFFPQGLAFGTVPVSTGVIKYLQMAAVVALILMAAQDRGSADLDGSHDPQMIAGQPMGFPPGTRAVLTEDLRHLKTARCSHLLPGLRIFFGLFIKGTRNLGQVQPADMQIDGGRCGGPVAEKKLDMMETRSRFNQMGRKAVP